MNNTVTLIIKEDLTRNGKDTVVCYVPELFDAYQVLQLYKAAFLWENMYPMDVVAAVEYLRTPVRAKFVYHVMAMYGFDWEKYADEIEDTVSWDDADIPVQILAHIFDVSVNNCNFRLETVAKARTSKEDFDV